MRNLRIRFDKTGRAKYVSHLDLNRCMLRAFRRSGVPIWYTEGFNPHPYMTFALPLPLGVESEQDVMDVRIDGEMENDEIVSRLNAVLPEGLRVTDAAEPWGKPDEIAAAQYSFFFDGEGFAEAALKEILDSGEILCEKMGKKNGRKVMKQMNLAEHIRGYALGREGDYNVLYIKLSAGNKVNANPVLLSDALSARSGGRLRAVNIRRTALLTENNVAFS
ncbi:MAG: TIGR03936 family radical SAM-associated protein [Oscillospiraceae bacterium]|jgi:radical SAM-linked protein|nr:TIGR03936 family radical SAM-associated protein [Oscillospiraceae bacterium]